ncbi:acyl-CoA thioesterase [Aegicerativicinus sediminis]|uniref:acyl-CoA thioesterase n=1 Tax=Aegicerativicinus sediminis TaxID=2893202 RepID=UPI001E56C3FF|nr:thioesterase family protein [Aegicerativicinus sediminis]
MENPYEFDQTEFRVRYGETDQMGVVYHGNYAQYFEVGRTEWLRKFGVTYKQMENDGIMLPVISININFKSPARYDDLVKVKTQLSEKPTAKISFNYELFNEKNDLLATGSTTLVFMDKEKNRPIRCPEDLLKKLTQ